MAGGNSVVVKLMSEQQIQRGVIAHLRQRPAPRKGNF
jgi:hypothetical protein